MRKKKVKKKVLFSNQEEMLNFSCEIKEFKEEEEVGKFTGILVGMQGNNVAKGYYRFQKGSMKKNNGKTLFLQYNHNGAIIPVGTLVGEETAKGFEVVGTFHLKKDENGAYINPEAAKLYSLMKDLGVRFEMSVGGYITDYKEYSENGKYYADILEFDAYEGSLTPKGAVPGSKVTKVFNNKTGGEKMTKEEIIALMTGVLTTFKEDLLKAGTDAEVAALPEKFNALTEQFNKLQESMEKDVKETFSKQLNELNDVLKGLKADFKATEEEVDEATQFKAILLAVNKAGQKVESLFTGDTVVEFKDMTTSDGKTTTTTGKAITKTTLISKIIERIQESNPVLKDVAFIPTSDGSMTFPREVAGLPETGWVGEAEERKETSVTKIENVVVTIYQLYALPVVTNKLLATNFVGYANFLLKRVEYALGLRLANAILNGTGTNMPLGILQDPAVDTTVEIDVTEDSKFADSIISIYYALPTEYAKTAKWYMRKETWAEVAKLKNSQKDFYITDLNTGNERTLMTRPVEIVESDDSGLKAIATAAATTDPVLVFGSMAFGVQGIENPKMAMQLQDQITSKGLTKYYMEKGVGAGVLLPECFVKAVKKA
ncbi:HK97 family phage major capsid protein [Fusobacterium necrophorum subsp. funduliforme]|uniref:phage major capsid protein n=1 Tax=Fusobacterium necrophorum TaxID=859 RepID=UPI00370EF865